MYAAKLPPSSAQPISSAPSRHCPECGAENRAAATTCWMCQGHFPEFPGPKRVLPVPQSNPYGQTFLTLGVMLAVGVGIIFPADGGFSILYALFVVPVGSLIAFILLGVRENWVAKSPLAGVFFILLLSGLTTVAMLIALASVCAEVHGPPKFH